MPDVIGAIGVAKGDFNGLGGFNGLAGIDLVLGLICFAQSTTSWLEVNSLAKSSSTSFASACACTSATAPGDSAAG